MNHDATHCLDCTPACHHCYRADLTRELAGRHDLGWMPQSWAHFKGSSACPRWPKGKGPQT